MRYERIERAVFLERPNRFIAYVELNGQKETVHVKNTGRCAELLVPGASVYVQRSANPDRKTKWDLIAVEKGSRMINMDSQIPNRVVQEWIEGGAFFENVTQIRPETTWGNSRFDLYVEAGGRKIFIEVKGVTLERDGVCLFPDAPSDRAVKHLEELARAVKEGYEAYVFFVIQMRDVKYFTPNRETHPAFADALQKAAAAGVHILAYDCEVSPDSIAVRDPVDVVLGSPELKEAAPLLVDWYRAERRDLPWRKRMNAYRVWISEIMLQQTRVETVIPYFERFIRELPDVAALAAVPDDRLMKLWEGLGYYSRARNLKETACRIMEEYGGEFPETYEEIRSLKGIGSYTAGAISSFVYHIPKPAVDGNVLRVVARITADDSDIARGATKKKMEELVEEVIPRTAPGDFNQSLIELGAIVCTPNGAPLCGQCPWRDLCLARRAGEAERYPVRREKRARKQVEATVLVLRRNDTFALERRGEGGLLARMWQFPFFEGEAPDFGPVLAQKRATHVFTHVEWHMTGKLVDVAQPFAPYVWATAEEIEARYALPSAFSAFKAWLR